MIRTVATKWKRLALELGFELSMIESIGNRYSDSEEDCEAMLRKWLMRPDATVSWEALMTALDNIGLNSIAQDLEKGILYIVMYLYHFLTPRSLLDISPLSCMIALSWVDSTYIHQVALVTL